MSNPLQPHGLQHAKLPCPSLSPEVCSNSCPLSRWCHPTISSSVTLFSCPQSFPASGSFPVSWPLRMRRPRYCSFCFSISPSSEYSGLISLRTTGLIAVKVKVAQSCPTLCDPMDYTVHGILQARILEWVACPFSSGSSWPSNQTGVSCTAGGFFTNWATREAPDCCGSIVIQDFPLPQWQFKGYMCKTIWSTSL